MFTESTHTLAMIQHAVNVARSAVQHINRGQVPVITADQPLFALAKEIQWWLLSTPGEDNFVVVLGRLHIEMAAFKVLGKWLSGSGWTETLVAAGVASPSTADSFLSTSHLTEMRRAHQITSYIQHICIFFPTN